MSSAPLEDLLERRRRGGFVLAEVLWSGSAILLLTTTLAVAVTRSDQSGRDRESAHALRDRLDRELAAGTIVVEAEEVRFEVDGFPGLRPGEAGWGVVDDRPAHLRWERHDELDRIELDVRSRGRTVRCSRFVSPRVRLRFAAP